MSSKSEPTAFQGLPGLRLTHVTPLSVQSAGLTVRESLSVVLEPVRMESSC